MDFNRIYETTNYDQFNWTEINRGIDDSQVRRLEDDIDKGIGIMTPILVNPQKVNGLFEIADGQHRFSALKNKSRPIRYIFAVHQMKLNDITHINSRQKPWATMDYVKAYAKAGKEDYVKLLQFFEEVKERVEESSTLKKVSIRSVSYLTQGNASNPNINKSKNIKNGDWEFRLTMEEARQNLDMFMSFEEFGCSLNETFIQALFSLMKNQDSFDVNRLIRQANKYPYKFINCSRGIDWQRMIEEVYNFALGSKNRVYFRFRK